MGLAWLVLVSSPQPGEGGAPRLIYPVLKRSSPVGIWGQKQGEHGYWASKKHLFLADSDGLHSRIPS